MVLSKWLNLQQIISPIIAISFMVEEQKKKIAKHDEAVTFTNDHAMHSAHVYNFYRRCWLGNLFAFLFYQ
jgi:hypothetical protein